MNKSKKSGWQIMEWLHDLEPEDSMLLLPLLVAWVMRAHSISPDDDEFWEKLRNGVHAVSYEE